MSAKPWGIIGPNSQHQRWSRWVFDVRTDRKRPGLSACVQNARRYFRKLFGSMGRIRVDELAGVYRFTIEIEGPAAHDPDYRTAVRRDFAMRFMAQGFGVGARLVRFEAGLLAGDAEDGTPPAQLLVMPSLAPSTHLMGS